MRILKGLGLFISGLGISLVVGWWLSQQERQQKRNIPAPNLIPSEPAVEPAIALPPEAFAEIVELPVVTQAAVTPPMRSAADDLTIIKGIGPKKAEALASIGITTFEALGMAEADELKEKLAGIGSIEQLEEWIAAAKDFRH